MTRYTLLATKVAPAGMAQGAVSDFAGAIPQNNYTDPGRRWAGDQYTTGPATDPEQAFAHFAATDDSDTEAWLDKQDDGTVLGWVRQGKDVWRYVDPHTWAADVDAAQMERVDAPALGEVLAPADAPVTDDTQEPSNQAAADPVPDPSAEPSTAAAADPAAAPAAEPAADPEFVPDEENPFLADDTETMNDKAAQVNDSAADDQADQPGDAPLEQDPNLAPADDAADPAPDAAPDAAPADPAAAPEDDEEELPWAKTQKKHLPGQHNQEDHGNWAHGIHVDHHHAHDGTPIRLPSGGSFSGPKASESGAPAPVSHTAPAKASIHPDALEHLSVENLEGIWASGEKMYDQDTLYKVADLLDQKNPLDGHVREQAGDNLASEVGAFAAVIPDHYVAWVARNNPHAPKPATRSKKAQIEDAYQHFIDAQYAQATADTKGVLLSKAGQAAGKDPMALFDGRLNRAQVRKFASEELLRWFAEHPRMTFQQFASEFYDSYAKATAHLQHAYLSEHG